MIEQYFKSFWEESKQERKNKILELLDNNIKNPLFLDCGCDNGDFTIKIASRLKTDKKFAIEINDPVIPEAQKKGIEVRKSNLNEKFPYQSNFFDVVVADQVIEHLWDLDNFVSEIYRTLKPGGYAIISTENLASWHNIFALILGIQPFSGPTASARESIGYLPVAPDKKTIINKHKNVLTMPPHIKILTLKAMVRLFQIYGFKVERKVGHGYIPFRSLPSKLLTKVDINHSFFITIKCRKSAE